MKKLILFILSMSFVLALAGCGKDVSVRTTYEMSEAKGITHTYYEMSDNTWKCNDTVYQYRLKLNGTLPNAAADIEFVVLTNDKTLDFSAFSKSLFSSSYDDVQKLAGSVVVEIH